MDHLLSDVLKAVVGAVVTLAIKTWFELRPFKAIGNRRSALQGKWMGTLRQHGDEPHPLEGVLHVDLTAKLIKIVGSATLSITIKDKPRTIELSLNGGFRDGSLLKLDYVNSSPNALQFGSIILRLNGPGDALDGRYAGYGNYLEKIVGGTVSLTRVGR